MTTIPDILGKLKYLGFLVDLILINIKLVRIKFLRKNLQEQYIFNKILKSLYCCTLLA